MNKKQLELNIFKGRHGGRRPGAGRTRIHSKGVAHRSRERVNSRTPMHINFKYKVQIKNKQCLKNLKRAILNARKMGLKVVHFSLQSNHVHLIVEAADNKTLSSGMRSLTVTLSKGIGRGKVQMERFHLHVLRCLRETRNAVRYVLFNEQKHRQRPISRVDGYSSLLAERNALKLISKFVQRLKVTMVVEKGADYGELSRAGSFLLTRSLIHLHADA